ncbi:uncharacterized protein RAG0_07367 [Rhynchosporium agropyri]|uniref:Uncharacterized protein n=1 Tax=Rhynchosporium agropyri TaxID=914238 RepID=A0A1E1KLE1_9HELO|nr:uncharacterized protein RAG0_07367 [Rhynchosporium agropyri]
MAVPVAAASHFTDSESRSKHPLSAQRQNSDKMGAFRGFEMRRWRDFPESRMSLWCDGFGDVKKPDPNAPEEPGARSLQRKVQEKDTQGENFSLAVCTKGTSALLVKFDIKGYVGSLIEFLMINKESGYLQSNSQTMLLVE